MIDFPRWKYWLVGIAMVLGLLYASPNAFRPQPAVQIAMPTSQYFQRGKSIMGTEGSRSRGKW
ncbi:MAG: hypothetical protein EPN40_03895, partial [Rhodanobacteraceae bacterium]